MGSSRREDARKRYPGHSVGDAKPGERLMAHLHAVPSEGAAEGSTAPARSSLVLIALILVAAVANLNLAVANVALPDIGQAFDSSQTTLNLIAVGYSLGLARRRCCTSARSATGTAAS